MGSELDPYYDPDIRLALTKAINLGRATIDECRPFTLLNFDLLMSLSASASQMASGELVTTVVDSSNTSQQVKIPIIIKIFSPFYDLYVDGGLTYESAALKRLNVLVGGFHTPHLVVSYGLYKCKRGIKSILTSLDDDQMVKFMRFIQKMKFPSNEANFLDLNMTYMERADGRDFDDTLKLILALKQPSEIASGLVLLKHALAQVLYTLMVFDEARIVHNDLHLGNIIVGSYRQKVRLVYFVSAKSYFELNTHIIVKLIDMDHSFIESLGANPIHSGMCKTYGVCSYFHPKFDLYTLLSVLYAPVLKAQPGDIARSPVLNFLHSIWHTSIRDPKYQRPDRMPFYGRLCATKTTGCEAGLVQTDAEIRPVRSVLEHVVRIRPIEELSTAGLRANQVYTMQFIDRRAVLGKLGLI